MIEGKAAVVPAAYMDRYRYRGDNSGLSKVRRDCTYQASIKARISGGNREIMEV